MIDIHGNTVRNLASVRVVTEKEAEYRRETLKLNRNRLLRLGLTLSAPHACDCCRMADHEYAPEDYL